MIQRILDILLAGLGLLLLFPAFVIIAVTLKLTGEGEVFFLQDRVGKEGNVFKIYKFATMLKNSPNLGTGVITVKDDPRVLPLGKFLRKSKLNELPQLWNIFIGEMSIVGPRPMVASTYAKYPVSAQTELNKVRPGLSGIGSIIFRDEEQYLSGHNGPNTFYEEVIIPYKSSLEIWYVKNNSLWIYVKVIVVTSLVVFRPSTNAESWFRGIPPKPEALRRL